MAGNTNNNRRRGRKSVAVPLAPPPKMQSRKKARKVTTLFHKLTRERDEAVRKGNVDDVEMIDRKIDDMGGRKEYQKASQVSCSFHSTSKWVLGCLSRNGWLYGIRENDRKRTTREDEESEETNSGNEEEGDKGRGSERLHRRRECRRRRLRRRPTKILEVGAINTELLDASVATVAAEAQQQTASDTNPNNKELFVPKYRIQVRAIDLHSMDPRIEEADFLNLPLAVHGDEDRRGQDDDDDAACLYDVIVCSMVLNCVTTPERRGEMMTRLYHFLTPGGMCFLTVPKTCLTLSPYMDRERFQNLLRDIGFAVSETKESPKVCFFVCAKPDGEDGAPSTAPPIITAATNRWTKLTAVRRGKKYRNDFAVIIRNGCYLGPIYKTTTCGRN